MRPHLPQIPGWHGSRARVPYRGCRSKWSGHRQKSFAQTHARDYPQTRARARTLLLDNHQPTDDVHDQDLLHSEDLLQLHDTLPIILGHVISEDLFEAVDGVAA